MSASVKAPRWLTSIQVKPIAVSNDGFGQIFVDVDGWRYRAPDFQKKMGSLVAPYGWEKLQNGAWKSKDQLTTSALEHFLTTASRIVEAGVSTAEAIPEVAKKAAGGFGAAIAFIAAGALLYLFFGDRR